MFLEGQELVPKVLKSDMIMKSSHWFSLLLFLSLIYRSSGFVPLLRAKFSTAVFQISL